MTAGRRQQAAFILSNAQVRGARSQNPESRIQEKNITIL
jgi:hypothetical protein